MGTIFVSDRDMRGLHPAYTTLLTIFPAAFAGAPHPDGPDAAKDAVSAVGLARGLEFWCFFLQWYGCFVAATRRIGGIGATPIYAIFVLFGHYLTP